jgi:hypothetical protein
LTGIDQLLDHCAGDRRANDRLNRSNWLPCLDGRYRRVVDAEGAHLLQRRITISRRGSSVRLSLLDIPVCYRIRLEQLLVESGDSRELSVRRFRFSESRHCGGEIGR